MDYPDDMTCAKVTGIPICMVGRAAQEVLENGRKEITPYWRVIEADGSLNEKVPVV